STYKSANGSDANVHLGNRDYLLQEMWVNANGGSCQLAWNNVSGGGGGGGDTLQAGSNLGPNQAIVSADGLSKAIMQPDGNFVLYQFNQAVWATNTGGSGGNRAAMQAGGNFVIYANNSAKWASNTYGSGGAYLKMQNDGNLVVYKSNGGAVWASNTNRSIGDTAKAGTSLGTTWRL